MRFFVAGDPVAQGSKKAMVSHSTGRAMMLDSNRTKLHAWRELVASYAGVAMAGRDLLDGPVSMSCIFWFTRPKKHYRTGKYSHLLRDDAPVYKGSAPDLDKLLRAIGDALTGVVYTDDARVATWQASKRWAIGGNPAGVEIEITDLKTKGR